MEASNLEPGELYVCRVFPSDRVSPIYRRNYAGKTAIYLSFVPDYEEHYGDVYPRWKFLIDGELRYMPEGFLKHLDLPDV